MGGFLAGLLGGMAEPVYGYGVQMRNILEQRRAEGINALTSIGTPEALRGAAKLAAGGNIVKGINDTLGLVQQHINETNALGQMAMGGGGVTVPGPPQPAGPGETSGMGRGPAQRIAAMPGTSPLQGGGGNLAGLMAAQGPLLDPSLVTAGLPAAAPPVPQTAAVPGLLPQQLPATLAPSADISQAAQPGTAVPSIQEAQALGGLLPSPVEHLRRVSQMTGYSPAEMMTFPAGRAILGQFSLNEAQLAGRAGLAAQEIQWKQQGLARAKADPGWWKLRPEERMGMELAASTPGVNFPLNFLSYGLRAEYNAQFRNPVIKTMSRDEAEKRWPDKFAASQIDPGSDAVDIYYHPYDLMTDGEHAEPFVITGRAPKGPISAYDLASGQLVSTTWEAMRHNPKLRPAAMAPRITDRYQLLRTDDGTGKPRFVVIDVPTRRTVGEGATAEAAEAAAGLSPGTVTPATQPPAPGGQPAAPVTPPVGPGETPPSPVGAPSAPGAPAAAAPPAAAPPAAAPPVGPPAAAGVGGGPAPVPTGRVKPGDVFYPPAFANAQAQAKAKGVLDAYGLTIQRAQWVYDHTDLLKDPARVARMQILLNTINPHSGSAIGGILQGLGGAVAAAAGAAIAGPAGAAAGAGLGPIAKAITPAVEAALARTFDLTDDEVKMVANHAILQENIMLLRQQFGIGFRNEQALAYQENQIGNLLTSDRVTHLLVGNAMNELATQYKDLAEPLGQKPFPIRLDEEKPPPAPPPPAPTGPGVGAPGGPGGPAAQGNVEDVPVERGPNGKLRLKRK